MESAGLEQSFVARAKSRQHGKAAAARPVRRFVEVTDAEIDAVARDFAGRAPTSVPPAAQPSMHELFNRQVRDVLDNSGLDEDEKQSILVAMACPCCGGGAASLTFRLRPKSKNAAP
jgi:hypothetical protein